ncbi:hypothetical protein DRQ07_09720, partial [candidate division KSB1 bacterium]
MESAKILIVEDERIVSMEIEDKLTSLGYNVVGSVYKGEDAIKVADREKPDLILMDIQLRGKMDGIETADKITSQYHIPIIFLTAYADNQTIQRAKLSKPYGYLLKPFETRELHSTIEMVLFRSRMETEISRNRLLLQTILNSIDEGVIAFEDNRIKHMNKNAERITGYNFDKVKNKPVTDIFLIFEPGSKRKVDYLNHENTFVSDHLLRMKNKKMIPVEYKISPLIDVYNNFNGKILIFRDITEKRKVEKEINETKHKLEVSEEKYQSLFKNIIDPVVIFSKKNKKILEYNEAFKKVYGYSDDEIKQMTPFDLHPAKDFELVKNKIDQKNTDKPNYYTHITKSGKKIEVEILSDEIEYMGKPAWISIIHDVTQRKKIEAEKNKRIMQTALINEVGRMLSTELDQKKLMEKIVTAVKESFNYFWVLLFLADNDKKCLVLHSQAGSKNSGIKPGLKIPFGKGMTGTAAQTGKIQVSGDVDRNFSFFRLGEERTQSELSIPILGKKGRVLGVLDIQSEETRAFNKNDMEAMETLSNQIAAAIENAELYKYLQRELKERKKAETRMRRLKEFHESILHNMSEGVVLQDKD